MDAMAEIRLTFFQECEEQLAALEKGLLSMQEGDTDSETVNAVFRAVHSIKGGAGAFKLDALVSFAHVFETSLDRVRSGSLATDADVMKLFLRAADALSDLVAESRNGSIGDTAPYDAIEEEFNALMGGADADAGADDDLAGMDFSPVTTAFDVPEDGPQVLPVNVFHIRFRPLRDMYAKANDPVALFRELGRIGSLTCQCDLKNLPFLDTMDPEDSYLSWDLRLETLSEQAAVKEVFDFVDGDCDLFIEAEAKPQAPAVEQPGDLDIVAIMKKVREEAPGITQGPAASAQAAGATEASDPAAPKAAIKTAVQPTIRVDLDRVDRLINLVG